MNYKVISSGSKGNCVLINDVMVDCGLAFSKIKEYLYDVKYLIITHTHADHLNRKTLTQIAAMFPRIQLIGNYEVHQVFKMNHIANCGYPLVFDDYIFTPFACVHDVLVYGYTWQYQDKKIIYATDTSTMEYAPDERFDYFFIESNHDEAKLEAARNEVNKYGYDAFAGGKRHLSTQQAKNYFYTHRRNPEAEFIELHKSKRFY
jgi:phosphoribosyl 1,2-cyclic phosphodiesterase